MTAKAREKFRIYLKKNLPDYVFASYFYIMKKALNVYVYNRGKVRK